MLNGAPSCYLSTERRLEWTHIGIQDPLRSRNVLLEWETFKQSLAIETEMLVLMVCMRYGGCMANHEKKPCFRVLESTGVVQYRT
eukprot:6130399-Amphidinium_carterae.1